MDGAKGCTVDLFYKARCTVATYAAALPAAYQYFGAAGGSVGGSFAELDYCPYYSAFSNGDCRVAAHSPFGPAAGGSGRNFQGEHYAAQSRCYVSTLAQQVDGQLSDLAARTL